MDDTINFKELKKKIELVVKDGKKTDSV